MRPVGKGEGTPEGYAVLEEGSADEVGFDGHKVAKSG